MTTNIPAFFQKSKDLLSKAGIWGDPGSSANAQAERAKSIDALALPAGAIPKPKPPADVKFKNARNEALSEDMRVRIKVPTSYIKQLTNSGGPIGNLNGIIFPYTPSISYESKAEYASSNPLHSNFTQYFYRHSSVSPISISGKFTVQNENDAEVMLGTLHLLRALLKMKSGGVKSGDKDSGSPPPVCRLNAYGSYMLDNVPVVITSFKLDLPDNVDYYTAGKFSKNQTYDWTAVPVISTLSITCLPIYSREEMQKFSVNGWLLNGDVRKSGYL